MTVEQFEQLVHEAQHALMVLNQRCRDQFRLGSYEHWAYDADTGTMTFSNGAGPKVVASVQVVGTTSTRSNTWLWSWANESIPEEQSRLARAVREYGVSESLPALSEAEQPNDEYLGWEMTALTIQLFGGIGGYRSPRESGGYSYYVFTRLEWAGEVERG